MKVRRPPAVEVNYVRDHAVNLVATFDLDELVAIGLREAVSLDATSALLLNDGSEVGEA